ncbi:hypothetical protein IW261DRAFT_1422871 [Armillaria novae-zelandiae]|uniref:Uncharacterized protein n=1 Tax=Armillaria novae-zelandiae TaxID=153914 RepID=A0AA39P057_9AGAR|nr:hypothetical protein IW261DRAFT_1422871 [Armillaria novae-zelandiae]
MLMSRPGWFIEETLVSDGRNYHRGVPGVLRHRSQKVEQILNKIGLIRKHNTKIISPGKSQEEAKCQWTLAGQQGQVKCYVEFALTHLVSGPKKGNKIGLIIFNYLKLQKITHERLKEKEKEMDDQEYDRTSAYKEDESTMPRWLCCHDDDKECIFWPISGVVCSPEDDYGHRISDEEVVTKHLAVTEGIEITHHKPG